MESIRECFESLRLGKSLTDSQSDFFQKYDLKHEQCASALAALSIKIEPTESEIRLKNSLAAKVSKLAFLKDANWYTNIFKVKETLNSIEIRWLQSYLKLYSHQKLGRELINDLVQDIKEKDNLNQSFTAAFLMFVCRCGMDDEDLVLLTKSMVNSGPIYDYRNLAILNYTKLVRRYPTGALSEKTAIILPALIAVAREVVNVSSPFLVAKSLGFTGGTWDKLSAIKSFKFPLPGKETENILIECGVAMTVTLKDVNPVDRILYQLRSVTGTIESHPLIISSIASKHIAIPVDRLLMDVRYGEGAFLADRDEAEILAKKLIKVLNENNVTSFYELTDTDQPTGSAIGNAIELAEAIEVMSSKESGNFNLESIKQQKNLVIHFFGLLMASEFSNKQYEEWKQFAISKFNDGSVLKSFIKTLIAHNVSPDEAAAITANPISFLNLSSNIIEVKAEITGSLKKIRQKDLGEIVYTRMGAANNQFSGNFNPNSGIIIIPRKGEKIKRNDVIAKLFYDNFEDSDIVELVRNCFEIE